MTRQKLVETLDIAYMLVYMSSADNWMHAQVSHPCLYMSSIAAAEAIYSSADIPALLSPFQILTALRGDSRHTCRSPVLIKIILVGNGPLVASRRSAGLWHAASQHRWASILRQIASTIRRRWIGKLQSPVLICSIGGSISHLANSLPLGAPNS